MPSIIGMIPDPRSGEFLENVDHGSIVPVEMFGKVENKFTKLQSRIIVVGGKDYRTMGNIL